MASKSKSKSARIWYARYPGDYARKTKHLSLAEHGAYALLMDWYYSNEKPLPLDVVQLHRICTAVAPHEADAVHTVLHEFFTQEADGWHNQRVDEEIVKKRGISEKRRAAQASREKKRLEKQGANGGAKKGANAPTTTTTTKEDSKPLPLNNPQAVENGDESEGPHFDVGPLLTDRERDRYRQVAPGQDIGFYIREYNAWILKKGQKLPRFPGKHFLAWAETFFKNQNKNFEG